MNALVVEKTDRLTGTIRAPPSKAETHRAIITTAFSPGKSRIKNALICDDTLATIKTCSMLGVKIRKNQQDFEINGEEYPTTPTDIIHCRDSGSTVRFIAPICALTQGISVLTGNEGLKKRPMEPMLNALRQLDVRCISTRRNGRLPIIVFGGGIEGGRTSIRGDISSQFVSGLLFGLPKARQDTKIILTSPAESKPYIKLTLSFLQKHGIKVEYSSDFGWFNVPGNQKSIPCDHQIAGDYSSAAFPLAAASIIDSRIKLTNLLDETLQGDQIILDILRKMGVSLRKYGKYVEVENQKKDLAGITVNVKDIPDLAPICTVLACYARGDSKIYGIKRLRFKESDRSHSISEELRKMGGKVKEYEEFIMVKGRSRLHGTELNSHNDHRIAMALTIAALGAEGNSTIHGIECINKSYPNFIEDLKTLGGQVYVK